MTKLFTATNESLSINMPRWGKAAAESISDHMDVKQKLKAMTAYAKALEKFQADLEKMYGAQTQYKALKNKHNL